MSIKAAFACLAGFLTLPLPGAAAVPEEGPLLQLARQRQVEDRDSSDSSGYYSAQIARLQHELARARPPSDAECAGSMAAGKYAELHLEHADALYARGDLQAAVAAYRSALACRPRSARILGQLAQVWFAARDFEAARGAVKQALDIAPRDVRLHRLAGNLDFVAERWADAAARFRYVATSDNEPEGAAAGQLMFWLAQRRAGVSHPEFITRRMGEYWPQPLVLFSKGERTEAELAQSITIDDDEYMPDAEDRRLSAALFYAGQAHWAGGAPDVARQYFAAVVNIRATDLDEYRLALAEIAKLNAR